MEILAKALHPDAVLPSYANEGDAGCDLVAIEDALLKAGGGRAMVGTGVAIAIPQGHGGFVLPRSGLASKHGVTCSNAPGLKVALVNLDPTNDYEVKKGDRIAQLVILAVPSASFSLVDELPEATRGEGGFGSTGR